METYARLLNYAIVFFLTLLLIEAIAAWIMGRKVIRGIDTLSSLSSGMTNAIKDVLGLSVVIVTYAWVVERIAIFEITETWWVYLLAFIGIDFAGYWVHRLSHHVNYFWNRHIIHHSSEEFNLACALRQSISGIFAIGVFFMLPMAFIGIPAKVVAIIAPLHLFAQYWYHTRLIGKMGILEHIIVTPSHHRVHHAINTPYLDKNLAQIFIIWDKIFGTFQEELEEEPPVYGVKRPVKTWNPVLINFMHLWQLIKDAWNTRSWSAKFKIWFMPTGWRPADVAEKYPLDVIEDVYAYKKYAPDLSFSLKTWSWMQFVICLLSQIYLMNNIGDLGFKQALIFGLFIILSIFSYTTLMDKNELAWGAEGLRMVTGIGLILYFNDWFLLNTFLPGASWLVMAYLVFSFLMSTYYVWGEIRQERKAFELETV